MSLDDQSILARARHGAGRAARAAWNWFAAFRRTRPFWGGLWTVLAGVWLVYSMRFTISLAVTTGWSASAGYLLGGGLVILGLSAWVAPYYKGLAGLLAWCLALLSFVAVNAGGYLIGTLLGVVGASMIWGWGAKAPRKIRRARKDKEGARQ